MPLNGIYSILHLAKSQPKHAPEIVPMNPKMMGVKEGSPIALSPAQ